MRNYRFIEYSWFKLMDYKLQPIIPIKRVLQLFVHIPCLLRHMFEQAGYMDEKLQYSFDWDYWLKFIIHKFEPAVFNETIIAHFRLHDESKTVKHWRKFNQEYVYLIN